MPPGGWSTNFVVLQDGIARARVLDSHRFDAA